MTRTAMTAGILASSCLEQAVALVGIGKLEAGL